MDNSIFKNTIPIDPELLSALDMVSSGKVVTAENWTTLWTLVFNKLNSVGTLGVQLENIYNVWEQAKTELNARLQSFDSLYNSLKDSFVHYGDDAPTNPYIKFWVQPLPLGIPTPWVTYDVLNDAVSKALQDFIMPTVDQAYNPESSNAQSGTAVAQASALLEKYCQLSISKLQTNLESQLVGVRYPNAGEVFNDYEHNRTYSPYASAKGHNTIAGTKAFQIIDYDVNKRTYTLDSVDGLIDCIGERFSIKWISSYLNCGTIIDVDTNAKTITVEIDFVANNKTPYTFITGTQGAGYVFLHNKPYLGSIPYDCGAYAEGDSNIALLHATHVEGFGNKAMGRFSHAENLENIAYYCTHVEGKNNKAFGEISHVEGINNISYGKHCHVEGNENIGQGDNSHTEGYRTKTTGDHAHSEGSGGEASGVASHKEGINCVSSGKASHTEGLDCEASNTGAHAGGSDCKASGAFSRAIGLGTRAGWQNQVAIGQYNNNVSKSTLFEIGNGNSDTDRKNAFEVHRNGNAVLQGSLTIGGVTLTANQLTKLLALLQ